MDELQRSFEALNDAEISKNRSAEIPEGLDYEGEKSFPEAFCDALQEFVDSVKEFLGLDTGSESAEVNETLSEKATEVMAEVFDSKTLSEWGTMSMEQREAKLNEYYAGLGEALGIDAKGVVVEDLFATVGEGVLGYNSGDGYLHIDYRNLQDPEQLLEVVQTTTHEARHQLQTEAIADPTRFPEIPPELISEWEHNMTNYDNGSFGYESYYNQGVEVDARVFAAQVINAYKTAMGV